MTEERHASHDRSEEEIQRDLRELALVDRILGLEAEVARLSILVALPAGPRSGYDRMFSEVWRSRTWRVGRAVLAPVRALRSIRRLATPDRS